MISRRTALRLATAGVLGGLAGCQTTPDEERTTTTGPSPEAATDTPGSAATTSTEGTGGSSGTGSLAGTVLAFPSKEELEAGNVDREAVEAGTVGDGLRDVAVSLPDAGRTAATNGDGEFRLENVAPGEHELELHKDGYPTVTTRVAVEADRTTSLGNVRYAESDTLESVTALSEPAFAELLLDDDELLKRVGIATDEGFEFSAAARLSFSNGDSGVVSFFVSDVGDRVMLLADVPGVLEHPVMQEISGGNVTLRNPSRSREVVLSADSMLWNLDDVSYKVPYSPGQPSLAGAGPGLPASRARRFARYPGPRLTSTGSIDITLSGLGFGSPEHEREFTGMYEDAIEDRNIDDAIDTNFWTGLKNVGVFLGVVALAGIGFGASVISGGSATVGALGAATYLGGGIVLDWVTASDIVEDIQQAFCDSLGEYYCVLVGRTDRVHEEGGSALDEWEATLVRVIDLINRCIEAGLPISWEEIGRNCP